MSIKRYFGPDPDKTRLRATIATLGLEIDRLAPPAAEPSVVQMAYRALVTQLALGAEPAVRGCPRCGTFGMAAATICGNCWTALTPELH
jgi:hypothetical protein